jgi:uncharacterized protein YacL
MTSSSEPVPEPSPAEESEAPAAPAEPEPRRRRPRPPFDPEEVSTRVTLQVVRGVFVLACAGIGYFTSSQVLFETESASSRLLYVLSATGLGLVVIAGEVFSAKAPVRTLAAIGFGLLIGLAMSLVFRPVIEFILSAMVTEGQRVPHLSELLQLIATTIFCYFGVTVLLRSKDDLKFIIPYVEFRKEVRGRTPLLLDTSVLIDGRLPAVAATCIIDQRLVVPRFVLSELQAVADSADRARRERGRRGLEALRELQSRFGAEVLERDVANGMSVDQALLELAVELRGKLLTTDYNLQRRAQVQEVPVANINDLASALKTLVVPGESLRVRLLRAGEDAGQAVGFLADGTMVVVESSSRQIGREVLVEVTGSTQTPVGKMVFARLRRGAGSSGRERQRPEEEP